jgi:hypothetical protein|tara:strand:- start:506 stop:709 length:204 start_codon:yes stop_codon:yes gene_type:complete
MRIFELVDLEFKAKKLRLEEDIENVINNKEFNVALKVDQLTSLFERLAVLDLAEVKYKEYLPEEVKK